MSTHSKITVLVTGAGAPAGPGVISALIQTGNYNVVGCDADADATGRLIKEAKFEQVPKANSSEFIPAIRRVCKAYEVKVVMPVVTMELFPFSKHKAEFAANGITVLVSGEIELHIANNKCRLYEKLAMAGVSVPKFLCVNTYSQWLEGIKKIGYPNEAVCMKPGVGNGSRGVRIIDPKADAYEQLFHQKPGNLYTTFEQVSPVLKAKAFPELLISEVLPGEEITVDAVVYKGEPKLILCRKRTKMNNGISTKGEFFYDEELYKNIHHILSILNLDGPIGLQFKKNKNGEYKILEINPRIQGTTIAAFALGLNLPDINIKTALSLPVKLPDYKNLNWGARFARYYAELYY